MEVFLFFGVLWLIFAGFGAWIAAQKGRATEEGFLLGLLFGPLGCLVEAVLPTIAPPTNAAAPLSPEDAAKLAAAEQDRRSRERADHAARLERDRQERRKRMEEDEARRQANIQWFRETVIRFGWFKTLPETAQPIILGFAAAVPLVILTVLGLSILLPDAFSPPVVEAPPAPVAPQAPFDLAADRPPPPPPAIGDHGGALVSIPSETPVESDEADVEPDAVDAEKLDSLRGLASKDVRYKQVLKRFMDAGPNDVLYFDSDEIAPRMLAAGSVLVKESATGAERTAYSLDVRFRKMLAGNPEIYGEAAAEPDQLP